MKEQSKKNVDQVQKNIQNGGRILMFVCRAVRIFLWAAILLNIGLLVAVFFTPEAQKIAQKSVQDNALYRILTSVADLGWIDARYRSAIGCIVSLLTMVVLSIFARSAQGMFSHLAEGGRPFNVDASRKMRRSAWLMLVMMIYNIPLGLISFFIIMLFSYIMEYGAYIQEQADETNRIQEEMIVSFAEITENKSGQTGQHVRRVSEYTKVLAKEMGMDAERSENLRLASTMHDIGKLLIPSEILDKPGRLTDEEYEVIKQHTTYGGQLLEHVEGDVMGMARTVALEHHERPDGRGYPSGKQAISLEGRIVAVADVYDALTSRRSYKEAWDEGRAYDEIVQGSGTQFDPEVVEAFRRSYGQISEIREKYRD